MTQLGKNVLFQINTRMFSLQGDVKSNYVPNFANTDFSTENVLCFRRTRFAFVQETLSAPKSAKIQ